MNNGIKITDMPSTLEVKDGDSFPVVQDGINKIVKGKTIKSLGGDYNKLINRPSINGHELRGAQTSEELGIKNGKDGRNGVDGQDGANGQDGKTPIKGVDYFTPSEIGQIKQDISNEYDIVLQEKLNKNLGQSNKGKLLQVGSTGNIEAVIFKEQDPTVPSWAKQINKPAYTASEVGALPASTVIPTKLSQLANDEKFLKEHQSLADYVKKNELPKVIKNYEELNNLPSINGITLEGNILSSSLGISNGKDGKTPVKGVDYFTASEISTIENNAINKIKPDLDKKLNNNLGAEQSGKFLGVNSVGAIVTIDPPKTEGGGITKETDPTVPSWAKQPNKPTYTAKEVGALPKNTKIPTKTSELTNDSNFLTEHQSLSGYAKTSEIPTKLSELQNDENFLKEHQPLTEYAKKTEIPEKLPTTNKLTFAGALSASFDGSSPVTVNIPVVEVSKKDLDKKLNILQGQDNSGKFLSVGSDGNVILVDPPKTEGGGITEETDPTVPSWAKSSTKPTYTAEEVGALSKETKIPKKVSELTNDSNFLTKNVADTTYAKKSEGGSGYTLPKASSSALGGVKADNTDTLHDIPVQIGAGDKLYSKRGVVIQSSEPQDKDVLWINPSENNEVGNNKYTLPVASDSTLGGAKVSPYDESFTEPVSLDPVTQMLKVKKQSGGGSGEKPWKKETITLEAPVDLFEKILDKGTAELWYRVKTFQDVQFKTGFIMPINEPESFWQERTFNTNESNWRYVHFAPNYLMMYCIFDNKQVYFSGPYYDKKTNDLIMRVKPESGNLPMGSEIEIFFR